MADREKVIKGLECCILSDEECECPDECPYHDDCWETDYELVYTLKKDALELLKEQEPVEYVVHCKNANLSNGTEFACGECGGSLLHKKVNYCPWCGRAVKWE